MPEGAPKSLAPVAFSPQTDQQKLAWIAQHKPFVQPLLQWWATDFRRARDPHYWVRLGEHRFERTTRSLFPTVNDDLRYPNEADILNRLGFTLVRIAVTPETQYARVIKRDGRFDPSIINHPTERALDAYAFDATIDNNHTLADLYRQLDALVRSIARHQTEHPIADSA